MEGRRKHNRLSALLAIGALVITTSACAPKQVAVRTPERRQAEPVAENATVPVAPSKPATPTPPPAPAKPKPFDVDRVMRHARVLASDIGVRFEGSAKERQAGDYVLAQLRGMGYEPAVQDRIPLPNGTFTRNVILTLPGRSETRIVLASHYDSKKTTPGANDDASGIGLMLELARDFKDVKAQPTVVLAFVGSEEIIGNDGNQHHFGARYYAKSLSKAEMARIAAMISVDMVGYGTRLTWRNRRKGPQSITEEMLELSRKRGIPTGRVPDQGPTGWSDHEPFEDAGVPAVWMQWRTDPVYHGMGDTPAHLQRKPIKLSGELLSDWLWQMDAEKVDALLATSEAR